MRKEDKRKLTINRRFIVNHLIDLETVWDYLISYEIFTPTIRERIIHTTPVPTDRIRQTLDVLVRRGPTSYLRFLEALIISGNAHIANHIDRDYCNSDECRQLIERETRLPIQATQAHHNSRIQQPQQATQATTLINQVKTNKSRSRSRPTTPANSQLRRLGSRDNSRSGSVIASCRITSPSINNYSHDDTINVLDTLKPTGDDCNQDIDFNDGDDELNWDIINNFDLDFEVLTNRAEFLDLSKPRNQQCYKMSNIPRGVCLLINNEHFYDHNQIEMKDYCREGTNMDASRLQNLFEKLKFTVDFKSDLTEAQMKQEIQKLANESRSNSRIYDMVCLIVLSHGEDGYINGIDYENKINIDKDILNLFDDVLIGKPKLFIFQACRGENVNQKSHCSSRSSFVDVMSRFTNMSLTPTIQRSTSSFSSFTDGIPIHTNLPSRIDFLIWYSSVRGFVSHRDHNGSPFIKCVVAVFSRYAKDLEMMDMVRKVNMLMKQYEKIHFDERNSESRYFMLPEMQYLATKKLYFNP